MMKPCCLVLLAPISCLVRPCASVREIKDETDAMPACLERVLSRVYAQKMPILTRLWRLEQVMQDENCVLHYPLTSPVRVGSVQSAAIGPTHFVSSMRERLQKTPQLPAIQPFGSYVDPDPLLDVAHECPPQIVDKERPAILQDWSMCTVYEAGEPRTKFWNETQHLWADMVRPMLASNTLMQLKFSTLGPKQLVEWHADYAFSLLSESDTDCHVSPEDHFDRHDPHPWLEMSLKRVRLQLPLSDQSDVRFFVSGERIQMHPGEWVVFDFYQPHSLYNVGTRPRVNLLVDFDMGALSHHRNMHRLVQSRAGREILGAILRMGYQYQHLNRAREDMAKLLYAYQHEPCQNTSRLELGDPDELRRLLRERSYAGLPQIADRDLREDCENMVQDLGCLHSPNKFTSQHHMRRVDLNALSFKDFTLEKCLGAGRDGEVWLARTPNGTARAVKLAVVQPELGESRAAEINYTHLMCERARALKFQKPTYFVDCLDFGVMEVPSVNKNSSAVEWLFWVVFEYVPGRTVKAHRRRRELCGTQVWSSLASIIDVALQGFDLLRAGWRPEDDNAIRYMPWDMHEDQIKLVDSQMPGFFHIKWLDYDDELNVCNSGTCGGKKANCWESFGSCPKQDEGECLKSVFVWSWPLRLLFYMATDLSKVTSFYLAHQSNHAMRAACSFDEEDERINFTDADGDRIEVRLEGRNISMYSNGTLSVADVQSFSISRERRQYEVEKLYAGSFSPDENLTALIEKRDTMFEYWTQIKQALDLPSSEALLDNISSHVWPEFSTEWALVRHELPRLLVPNSTLQPPDLFEPLQRMLHKLQMKSQVAPPAVM